MIKQFMALFSQSADQGDTTHTVELATAALLSEVLRADSVVQQTELDSFKLHLVQHFSLSEQEMTALLSDGQEKAEEAVDLVQFTQVINDAFDNTGRVNILRSLWSVALADGHLDMHEEHIIRRIADLLYIPHSQFIQTKLQVMDA